MSAIKHLEKAQPTIEGGQITLTLDHRTHRDLTSFEALCQLAGMDPDSFESQALWNADELKLCVSIQNTAYELEKVLESFWADNSNSPLTDLHQPESFLKADTISEEEDDWQEVVFKCPLANSGIYMISNAESDHGRIEIGLTPQDYVPFPLEHGLFDEMAKANVCLKQQFLVGMTLNALLGRPPFMLSGRNKVKLVA